MNFNSLVGQFRSAVAWRWWYYKNQVATGVLARCANYPRVFDTAHDMAAYAKLLMTLDKNRAPVSLSIKALGGGRVLCRAGTSDPWVLWDTFYSKFHLPPREVSPKSCVIDLGANVGYTTAHFAWLYPHARVIAVEMDRANAELAAENVKGFGPRCYVLQAAVWSKDGQISYGGNHTQGLRVSSLSDVPEPNRAVAPARTLDSIFEEFDIRSVDYLKMDIEGAEAAVFKGSLAWAERVKAIKIEIHPPASIDECARILSGIGFRCRKEMAVPPCLVGLR